MKWKCVEKNTLVSGKVDSLLKAKKKSLVVLIIVLRDSLIFRSEHKKGSKLRFKRHENKMIAQNIKKSAFSWEITKKVVIVWFRTLGITSVNVNDVWGSVKRHRISVIFVFCTALQIRGNVISFRTDKRHTTANDTIGHQILCESFRISFLGKNLLV